MNYLSSDEIVDLNRRTIASYGGYHNNIDNIANSNSLEYIVGLGDDFRLEYNLNIYDIAARYAYHIIQDHIFYDGNKRTAIECIITFLNKNGLRFRDQVTNDMYVDIALETAMSRITIEQLSEWIENNSSLI